MSVFENLNDQEYQLLKDTFGLIATLIAGADGNIDEEEQSWAQKIVKIRSFSGNEFLYDFYDEVDGEIIGKMEEVIGNLKGEMDTIQSELSKQISKVNPVLAKLDEDTAHQLYKGYLSFAEHIAKASGGIFRFFAISSQEKKFLDLDMIHVISEPADEEE